jgi:hypothetical protein
MGKGLLGGLKVIIGGVSASAQVAERYGCGAYVSSAFEAVEVCDSLLKERASQAPTPAELSTNTMLPRDLDGPALTECGPGTISLHRGWT